MKAEIKLEPDEVEAALTAKAESIYPALPGKKWVVTSNTTYGGVTLSLVSAKTEEKTDE